MTRLLSLIFLFLTLSPALAAQPESAAPARVAISGINATDFPRVVVTVDVTDGLGQPLLGLGARDFALGGTFGAQSALTEVVNVQDDNLPIAAVLAIDVSDSMSGTPLARAKDAALAFIDALRPDDQVAVVVFGSISQIVQDFTTDRDRLRTVIDVLAPVGQTALYQGAYDAVRLASAAPLPRRAVILLGDGAEFGGRSRVPREAALSEAIALGVPVYTVGLGFGADRSYLEALSVGTNAQFFESPTPETLLDIYRGLAARFRSQYILTLDAFIPGDGTIYTLDLSALGSTASASFRAPIPVPLVRVLGVPVEGVVQPFSVLVEVLADQPLASIMVDVPDGQSPVNATGSPFIIDIDPLRLMPGEAFYTVRATDADGDVGEASFVIDVSAAIGLTQTETARPTATLTPSATATLTPSPTFTASATFTPSATASATPTLTLTPSATFTPSRTPTASPTPSMTPDLRATAEAQSAATQAILVVTAEAQSTAAQIALLGTQAAVTQEAVTAVARATEAQITATAATQFALQTQAVATDVAEGATARAQERAEETTVALLSTQAADAAATAAIQTQAADALATASAATEAANRAATAFAQTQVANETATAAFGTALASTQFANATNVAIVQATQRAEATQAAGTLQAQLTGTALAAEATATNIAQVTQTAEAQATAAEATARILTLTPQPTPALIEAQAENPPSIGDLLPFLCIIAVVVGALTVMLILLSRQRTRRRKR